MRKLLKKFTLVLFGVYIFAVLWITLINRESGQRRAMLVPFWEFANVVKGVGRDFYTKQILGNLVMLMPLGFMLPTLIRCGLMKIGIIAFFFSEGIELTQFVTGRGLMEFDDVFNNTAGALIGYQIFILIRRTGTARFPDSRSIRR